MNAIATVPGPNDADVLSLLALNALTGTPQYLPFEDHGYDPQWCHVSAKHHALIAGGKRVHGWAIWRWDVPEAPAGTTILMAEHHSVWEAPDGRLLDVTPPRFGAQAVLFVRDDSATIDVEDAVFLMRTDLTSSQNVPRMLAGQLTQYEFYPLDPSTRPDVKAYAERLGFDLSRLAAESRSG